jgi:hypothetical protein
VRRDFPRNFDSHAQINSCQETSWSERKAATKKLFLWGELVAHQNNFKNGRKIRAAMPKQLLAVEGNQGVYKRKKNMDSNDPPPPGRVRDKSVRQRRNFSKDSYSEKEFSNGSWCEEGRRSLVRGTKI